MKFLALCVCLMMASSCRLPAQDDTQYPPPQSREPEIALFNGKDFSGLTFCMRDNSDPQQTWSITNGVIHCTGKSIGYMRTTQIYSNYFLTVEFRFRKIAPKADNTGILVDMQPPDKVWPQCVQVQGKHDHLGDLFLMEGAESKEHKGMDKNTPIPIRGQSRENPVGEWNKCETICINNKVISFINGYFVNETTECTLNGGYIGIQSEGADMEIRSMYFCSLKY